MPDPEQVERERAILLSARVRFAPETQSLREAALERLVEQILATAPDQGLSLPDIEGQAVIEHDGKAYGLRRSDVRQALGRLTASKRANGVGTGLEERRYRLSMEAEEAIQEIRRHAERRFDRIVRRLFRDAPTSPENYGPPFLEAISLVFSRLGDEYVGLLTGDVPPAEFTGSSVVEEAISSIAPGFAGLDTLHLARGVLDFLVSNDPDANEIKWNLGQNHYLLRALGLDSSGYLLSEDLLSNAVLYLDTNVLFQALLPSARHHRHFQALSRAARRHKIHFRVCQISVDELRRFVGYQKELISTIGEQIPDDLVEQINSELFQAYREAKRGDSNLDPDAFFHPFEAPLVTLKQDHTIELIDDLWFDDAMTDPKLDRIAQDILRVSLDRRPNHPKRERAALHDALLLSWVERERTAEVRDVWLVTLDTTLPVFIPDLSSGGEARALAITLDGLLQWLSPLALDEDVEEDFSQIFADALKQKLLPQDTYFELSDFLIFRDLEVSTRELPAEDVADCVRHIRKSAPRLDPNRSEDREKLAHEIARFFVDPGRKYRRELDRLRQDNAALRQSSETSQAQLVAKYESVQERLENQIEDLRENEARTKEEHTSSLAARDSRIDALERRLSEAEAREAQDVLRRSALRRLTICMLLLLALEGGAALLAAKLGSGQNLAQKLASFQIYYYVAALISLVASWFVLGRRRLQALGWPFTKLARD